MKTIKNSVLWSLLAATPLVGCSSLQPYPLYSLWQERAYSAYGMPVPAPSASPFMTAAMPYVPSVGHAWGGETVVAGRLLSVVEPVSPQEEKFIADYYSLQ